MAGFFAIFEHCSSQVYNNMQRISETSETVCRDSNLLTDASLVDISYTISDTRTNTSAFSEAKSSATSFYTICLSVLKSWSYWNSDTLDAIVESGMLNDRIEYWISSSEQPQNININGTNNAVSFVF